MSLSRRGGVTAGVALRRLMGAASLTRLGFAAPWLRASVVN
jgi:hypothetical protein